jgi:hypothetical protein
MISVALSAVDSLERLGCTLCPCSSFGSSVLLALMRNCPTCWGKTAPTWVGKYPAQTAVALKADWVNVFRQMGQFVISAYSPSPFLGSFYTTDHDFILVHIECDLAPGIQTQELANGSPILNPSRRGWAQHSHGVTQIRDP